MRKPCTEGLSNSNTFFPPKRMFLFSRATTQTAANFLLVRQSYCKLSSQMTFKWLLNLCDHCLYWVYFPEYSTLNICVPACEHYVSSFFLENFPFLARMCSRNLEDVDYMLCKSHLIHCMFWNLRGKREMTSRLTGCCSVAKSCLILCDPMDCSTPGFPVLQCLLEFAQTAAHWVGDAIQPSLWPSSLLPSVFPSLGIFSSDLSLRVRWPKYWSFSVSISPSNEYSGLISFRMDWLDWSLMRTTHPEPWEEVTCALRFCYVGHA